MTPDAPKKPSALEKTAQDFALKLAKTMTANDPAADQAYEAREAAREAKVTAALRAHLGKKKPKKK